MFRVLLPFFLVAVALAPGQETTRGSISVEVVTLDGDPLPGAIVTATADAFSRSFVTDANGRSRFVGLAAGDYNVSVSFTGFITKSRPVSVRVGRNSRIKCVLQADPPAEGISIRGMQDAASNRPGFHTQRGIAQGSIFTVFTQNAGPEALTQVSELPLSPELAGVRGWTETDSGERIDAFPVFVSANQSAFVQNAELSLGEHQFFVSFGGRTSDGFRFLSVPSQPSIYTFNQAGFDQGVFTGADFSLITRLKSAVPGQAVIVWGNGFAPNPFDAEIGVQDFRGDDLAFEFFLGNQQIPEADIPYLGSPGGFVGGTQGVFTIPPDVALGCGVPFLVFVTDTITGEIRITNSVSIPISADGGPCSDPTGLSEVEVSQLFEPGGLNFGALNVTEIAGLAPGQDPADLLLGTIRAENVDSLNLLAPVVADSCGSIRTPPGAAIGPVALEFTGTASATLPWALIDVPALGNVGPGRQLFELPPADQIINGPFEISTSEDFSIDGTLTSLNGGGDYERRAGSVKEVLAGLIPGQLEGGQAFLPADFTGLFIDAGFPPEDLEGLFVTYHEVYDAGDFGLYQILCNSNLAGLSDDDFMMYPYLLGGMPDEAESIFTRVAMFLEPTASGPSGTLDRFDVNFDALIEIEQIQNPRDGIVERCASGQIPASYCTGSFDPTVSFPRLSQ